MRGRTEESTNPPATLEPTGPTDERFVYSLTEAGKRALDRHRAETGETTHCEAAPLEAVAPAVADEAYRRRRRARVERARSRGRRAGTVCGRMRTTGRVSDLRLSGQWLQEAGFGIGQPYEVEVDNGRLTIEAV